jgi:hypothetical protein
MNSAAEIRAIANNEAERLIGLLYERFDDPMDARMFMQPLNHMLLGGDFDAAIIAVNALFAVCGDETSEAFDTFIESIFDSLLLFTFSERLKELFNVFIVEEDGEECYCPECTAVRQIGAHPSPQAL